MNESGPLDNSNNDDVQALSSTLSSASLGGNDFEGQAIADLIDLHKEKINELQAAFGEELKEGGDIGVITDELFFLRFLLSNKNDVEVAKTKIRFAISFRKEHKDLLKAAKIGFGHPIIDLAAHFQAIGLVPNMIGNKPVTVARVEKSDGKGLMKKMSVEEASLAIIAVNERNFQIVDAHTRSSGKLVKALNIVDLADFSIFGNDLSFNAAQGKSSSISDSLYPQLLGKVVLMNASTPLRWLIGMVSKLLSAKTASKLGTCPASETWSRSDCDKCPFLAKFGVDPKKVPNFLGGLRTDIPRNLINIHSRPGMHIWNLTDAEPSQETTIKITKDGNAINCNMMITSNKGGVNVEVCLNDIVLSTITIAVKDRAKQLLDASIATDGVLKVKCTKTDEPCTVQLDLCQ